MTKVHCTVDNCEYWETQNYCGADEILITAIPIQPDNNAINHHGKNAERLSHTPAQIQDGTYCYTFERR